VPQVNERGGWALNTSIGHSFWERPRVGRVWHPSTSLSAYYTASRRESQTAQASVPLSAAPGCRAVGLRRGDGMPHKHQRARSSVSMLPIEQSRRDRKGGGHSMRLRGTTCANRCYRSSLMSMRCPLGHQFMPNLMPTQSIVDCGASMGVARRAAYRSVR
jgi:hypothetical protein